MIYLDNASAYHPLLCAVKAFLYAPEGNPNSGHIFGVKARRALDLARETISECVGCLPEEVHFVSCASEAAEWALDTLHEYCGKVIVSRWEHHCVTGYRRMNAQEHLNPPECYRKGLVQMLVQNETGQIFLLPIGRDIDLLLNDATAALGHIPVNFKALHSDYIIGDAMKFGGIPGCGFLIAKKGAPLSWHHEGTPPVKLICAMAEALKWQTEHIGENADHVKRLNERMREIFGESDRFHTTLPEESVQDVSWVSPYILSCRFDGAQAQAVVAAASEQGVCISAGSACSEGNLEPSAALLSSGLTEEQAMQTIRISFSEGNTMREVERAAEIISNIAKSLM